MTTDRQADGKADRPRPPQLADVIDRMLDKGMIIESHNPVSMLDIGLLGVSSRISIRAFGRGDLLAGLLAAEQARRRSKSPARVRAHGHAQGSARRPGKPRRRLTADVRPGIA